MESGQTPNEVEAAKQVEAASAEAAVSTKAGADRAIVAEVSADAQPLTIVATEASTGAEPPAA